MKNLITVSFVAIALLLACPAIAADSPLPEPPLTQQQREKLEAEMSVCAIKIGLKHAQVSFEIVLGWLKSAKPGSEESRKYQKLAAEIVEDVSVMGAEVKRLQLKYGIDPDLGEPKIKKP